MPVSSPSSPVSPKHPSHNSTAAVPLDLLQRTSTQPTASDPVSDATLSQLQPRTSNPGPSSEPGEDGEGALTNVALLEDVPPNGAYGWVCTACVLLMNANTWGCNAVSL